MFLPQKTQKRHSPLCSLWLCVKSLRGRGLILNRKEPRRAQFPISNFQFHCHTEPQRPRSFFVWLVWFVVQENRATEDTEDTEVSRHDYMIDKIECGTTSCKSCQSCQKKRVSVVFVVEGFFVTQSHRGRGATETQAFFVFFVAKHTRRSRIGS